MHHAIPRPVVRLVAALAMFMAAAVAAAAPEIFSDPSGAIRGYDPVAYFTAGKPMKGSKAFQHTWRGATWSFVSKENLDRFVADPGRYAPQYGGYCAFGVANGYTPAVDPTAWAIVEGKLYLNLNAEVQQRWNGDRPGWIGKANAQWPSVLSK